MPHRTLEGIRTALSSRGGTQWAYVIIVLALLAILAALVHVLILQVRRRNRLRTAWRELARLVSARRLSPAEKRLVRQMCAREAPWSPADVIERIDLFEGAVERHLALLGAAASRSDSAREAAHVVGGLRAKLGFERPPGVIYYSTREIAPGQRLQLKVADGDEGAEISAAVKASREDLLELVAAHPIPAGMERRRVRAVFYCGNRAYGFESHVVEVDRQHGSCLLKHSLDVVPAGLREYHRVAVGRPITFRAAWEKPEVRREGLLCDLSAGGLALRCPCYYETGEQLLVAIEPAQYLAGGPEAAERLPEDRQVLGTIVETRHTADGRCVHHVEFRDISDEDRAYLLSLVRRIERELPA